jgi:hypothetical protein
MPPDRLTTSDTVARALRMFPDSVILPNHGCNHCNACQLITRSGTGVVTVHAETCPELDTL